MCHTLQGQWREELRIRWLVKVVYTHRIINYKTIWGFIRVRVDNDYVWIVSFQLSQCHDCVPGLWFPKCFSMFLLLCLCFYVVLKVNSMLRTTYSTKNILGNAALNPSAKAKQCLNQMRKNSAVLSSFMLVNIQEMGRRRPQALGSNCSPLFHNKTVFSDSIGQCPNCAFTVFWLVRCVKSSVPPHPEFMQSLICRPSASPSHRDKLCEPYRIFTRK